MTRSLIPACGRRQFLPALYSTEYLPFSRLTKLSTTSHVDWVRPHRLAAAGGYTMRKFGILGAMLIAGLILAGQASAENRTFIIPNNADGYGIDRCLANGDHCGQAVATNLLPSRSSSRRRSPSAASRGTRSPARCRQAAKNTCTGGSCENFVAITCSR